MRFFHRRRWRMAFRIVRFVHQIAQSPMGRAYARAYISKTFAIEKAYPGMLDRRALMRIPK